MNMCALKANLEGGGIANHLPRVAFLGPCGTYTHQAAYNRFSSAVAYEAKDSIAGACEALSPKIPFAVVPKENSIFGIVVETYDLQRSKDFGSKVFIRDEITLQVQHCLLVRKGVCLEDITRVLSHEQALGQCSQFLSERLPESKTVKTPSTAYAASLLLEDEYGLNSAAICSRICVNLYEGLDMLYEGIQNEKSNFTNFWVLATSPDALLPGNDSPHKRYAILRLASLSDSPDLLSTLSSLELFVSRVDRRPSPGEVPFSDMYFVEVTRSPGSYITYEKNYSDPKENGEPRWQDVVDAAVKKINSENWKACVIGVW